MEKMIQRGLGTREMFLIIPSLIYFEIEHYKFSCVHRVYKMSVYTEIMMQWHFSRKNIPSKEFLLSSYVNVFILMIISLAVFKFIFYYGCTHVWNSGVCMEKIR